LNDALKKSIDFPEFQRLFAPPAGRNAWREADRLIQPELARTLPQIASDGPDAFYRGSIAEQMLAEMQAGGGLLTKEDLASYQAHLRRPIHGTYRGYDIYGPPPPSSGGICLVEMLNILENSPLEKHPAPADSGLAPRWTANTMHLVLEAMRRAYCDRARYLGDADFTPIPAHLTSKEYAQQLARQIEPGRATRSEDVAPELVARR
jgi:gamma-glutamyltranspeptidase/glutathione hydrolase